MAGIAGFEAAVVMLLAVDADVVLDVVDVAAVAFAEADLADPVALADEVVLAVAAVAAVAVSLAATVDVVVEEEVAVD